jgi:tRNA U54 and U55 pseudouridine synthase Pus10
MVRKDEWKKVLDPEVKRWSAMSVGQLVSELRDTRVYEVQLDSKKYQVEVELLENTERYINVMVSVDDGSLPASLSPLTHTFIREKARSH